MRTRRLAQLGVAALLLAGCSDPELSERDAAEVVDASFTALVESGATHVVGSLQEGDSTQELDLRLQGEDAQGSIVLDGITVELVLTGGTAYVMAPADFWASFGMPAEFADQFEGRWVRMPPEAAASFGDLTLSGMVEQFRSSGGDSVEGEVTTDELDGEPVVVVTQEDGSTFTAADDDENPYPLLIEDRGNAPATVEFSDFGEQTRITAPPDPVDLSTLGG